ncbi:uncharacterized protein LOC117341711 [Pecten maximus]|uniref:uncharacterized protein LOC117341711 n=1 Tax=Pecten maximus TaxID=6579 RepID=UPI0014586528|nr:uncharacterized protein LOC117341711 [Pecten maximus]
MCDVIDNITKTIKTLFIPMQQIKRLNQGHFYLLRNIVMGETIRITEKTMVMDCSPFPIPMALEKEYINPPTLTVTEALASPIKRRINAVGTLAEASDVLHTEFSRRKILKISNNTDELTIKLWGQQSDLQLPQVGSDVSVSAIIVAQYAGRKEANSSSSTTISEIVDEHPFQGEIDAITFDRQEASIVLKDDVDNVYNVDTHSLQEIFPDLEFKPDVQVVGTRRGTKIISLKQLIQKD